MIDVCCDMMAINLNNKCDIHSHREDCPDALLGYTNNGIGIIIHDGSNSHIEIGYCPWCGKKITNRVPYYDDTDLFLPVSREVDEGDWREIHEDEEIVTWSEEKFLNELVTNNIWTEDRKIRAVFTYIVSKKSKDGYGEKEMNELLNKAKKMGYSQILINAFVFMMKKVLKNE